MIRDSVRTTFQLLAPLLSAYNPVCNVKGGRLTLILENPQVPCQEITPILVCDTYHEQMFAY